MASSVGELACFRRSGARLSALTARGRPRRRAGIVGSYASPEARPPSLVRRGWFWGVVAGGVAVAAAGVTLGLVFGGPKDPTSTLGTIGGN